MNKFEVGKTYLLLEDGEPTNKTVIVKALVSFDNKNFAVIECDKRGSSCFKVVLISTVDNTEAFCLGKKDCYAMFETYKY